MTGADDGPPRVSTVGADPDPRAALRAFVRAHHPDVGGDPELFRAGLAAHRDALRRTSADEISRLVGAAVADDDPRLDAPIVAMRGGPIHRIGRLGRRLVRRVDPRPGSARVR